MNEGRAGLPRDPTADSALLLQRIGFFTLGVALPVSAMLSRRAAVVLAPIGVALLVIAAMLVEPDRFLRSFGRRSLKATSLALLLFLAWSALSTVWGARDAGANERILNMALALGLGVAGVAALPERMRAANLYAVAVGVGASLALACGLMLTGLSLAGEDDILLTRGLALALVLAAPVAGWLLLRGRTRAAGSLLLVLLAAAALSGSQLLLAALAVALACFALVVAAGPSAVRALAVAAAALLLLAPAIALALSWSPGVVGAGDASIFGRWGQIMQQEPAKLITGHGFGAVLAQQRAGLAPPDVSILFEIWHELGLVGAAAFAAALWLAIRAVRPLPVMLQAGAVAAYAAALTLGVAGLAGFRAWWLMTIAAGVVLTTAIARGQGRTDRPLAAFVRQRAAPGEGEPAAPAATAASPDKAPAG